MRKNDISKNDDKSWSNAAIITILYIFGIVIGRGSQRKQYLGKNAEKGSKMAYLQNGKS